MTTPRPRRHHPRAKLRSYLGPATADGNVPPLAAPARYDDLSGLPPAWIGVGTNDLFHDEDVTYAQRLQQAGIACTLHGLLTQAAPQIFDEVMGELSALIAAGALGPAPTIHDLADGPTALAARETRTTIGPAALTIRRSPDAR